MKVLGAIIAGGKSSRMGQDKALMMWQGKALIAHVADALRPQVAALAINANGDAARFAFLNVPVFADHRPDSGTPLAGLHASLLWAEAQGFDAVLTSPCDTPFLPEDLRLRLAPFCPAIVTSGAQDHFLTGLWPVAVAESLSQFLHSGQKRAQDFARLVGATAVEWPVSQQDPFANINTPEDFALMKAGR